MARFRLRKKVGIWFHPQYVFRLLSKSKLHELTYQRCYRVFASLRRSKLFFAKDINSPKRPISWSTLQLFHTKEYLKKTTDLNELPKIIGLDLTTAEAEKFIIAQRLAVMGTVEATGKVVNKSCQIAINLGGGFHHAEKHSGGGFCLYNDIGVAICDLLQKGFAENILIVDLDYHQGNGNISGFANHSQVYNFSMHGSVWKEFKCSNTKEIHLLPGTDNERYLKILKEKLTKTISQIRPSLVFYIAGNDVLQNDAYGDFNLTLKGLFNRDSYVVELCQKNSIPMVITLGGAYNSQAWKGTFIFLKWLLTNSNYEDKNRCQDDLGQTYAEIARKLDTYQLSSENKLNLTEEDLFDGYRNNFDTRVLGYYSKAGIEFALKEYGFLSKIEQLGYMNLKVVVENQEFHQHLIRIFSLDKKCDYLLFESLIELKSLKMPDIFSSSDSWPKLINVEWLLLQNPKESTVQKSSLLPGQKYPGLGLAREYLLMLIQICKRLELDGILMRPAYYHVALKTCRDFKYLDPETEGNFLALRDILKDKRLDKASNEMENQSTTNNVKFEKADSIYPVSERMTKYFNHKSYLECCHQSYVKLKS